MNQPIPLNIAIRNICLSALKQGIIPEAVIGTLELEKDYVKTVLAKAQAEQGRILTARIMPPKTSATQG